MNDRQDPYAHDPYSPGHRWEVPPQQPQVYGYDAHGRPVYRPDAPELAYDAYGQPLQGTHETSYQQDHGYGYDPYAAQAPQQPYDPAAYQAAPPPQAQTHRPDWIPRQTERTAPQEQPEQVVPDGVIPEPRQAPDHGGADQAGEKEAGEAEAAYRTGQFSFVETPDEESEDVIDWLKFSESRTERRDERKRKGRNRYAVLGVALVLALAGGLAWFLLAGSGDSKGTAAGAGGPQQRDVIVVHLRQTKGGGSSTALLVDNATTKKASTVLLPNSLAVAKEGGGATTLGKSVTDAGTGATRDALNTLLGSQIKGSWRLDTPYLENLVQLVGGITVDTDTDVPGAKPGDGPLARRGKDQSLSGQTAVAYATYRAPREDQNKQLARFGQVMQAVLKKLSGDPGAATTTVETLAQIPDPSLSVKQLGASLAHLAARAKEGSYDTAVLPVRQDGTLDGRAADGVVKELLGGTVRGTGKDATPRVGVKNATGGTAAAGSAQVALVNGGYTYLAGGTAAAQGRSSVTYADDRRAAEAREVAKTLGLPAGSVKKGQGAANADITVILGKDYKG